MKEGLVTIIITVWKRDYLHEQLQSLIGQTQLPAQIWILHNERHIDIMPVVAHFREEFPAIYVIHSEVNFKYFGRFALCSQVTTPYVFLIDDDVIPGKRWLEQCIAKSMQYNAVISCTGRIIPPGRFRMEEWKDNERALYFIGDNYDSDERNHVPEDTPVDYGCNSYFFRTEWLPYFWGLWPHTLDSGEDIHLSGSLMISKGICTIVPAQTCMETSGNLKKYYSQDDFSSWKNPGFIDIRETVFNYLIKNNNWRPILWK